MISTHVNQNLLKKSINTGLAGRPLRLRHASLQKQDKRFPRKFQNRGLCEMAANSPVTKLQDITTRKEALSKMYEDSKNAFPDVRKSGFDLTAQKQQMQFPQDMKSLMPGRCKRSVVQNLMTCSAHLTQLYWWTYGVRMSKLCQCCLDML